MRLRSCTEKASEVQNVLLVVVGDNGGRRRLHHGVIVDVDEQPKVSQYRKEVVPSGPKGTTLPAMEEEAEERAAAAAAPTPAGTR